jgi:hypothetical protein
MGINGTFSTIFGHGLRLHLVCFCYREGGKRQICLFLFLALPCWQLGDPRRDDRPLAFRQVSPVQVGDDEL